MASPDSLRSRLFERRSHRITHVALASVLGIVLYSPLIEMPPVAAFVRLVVFPALVGSGLLLWMGPTIRARLREHWPPDFGLPPTVLGLTVLALAFGFGHHVDHVVRGNHVGWPLTERVTPFTVSLLSYPIVLGGLYLTWRGRVGARFWVIASVALTVPLVLTHFGPTAVEPPADIVGVYDHHVAGVAAFGWLLTFTLVMGLVVVAVMGWWRRQRAERSS